MKALLKTIVTSADLSPVVAGDGRGAGEGPAQPAARARPALPPGGGDGPRPGAALCGPPQPQDGRAVASTRRSRTGSWQAAFNGERTWPTSTGEDRYRRGLYTFWRRTVPYPSMATFDAPSRETCTLRRIRTNTPLQAFVTLNDPVYVEAAQALARRIVKEGGATPRNGPRSPSSSASSARQIRRRSSPRSPSIRASWPTSSPTPPPPRNWPPIRSAPRRRNERGGAGGVDRGGQRGAESGWRDDEGLACSVTLHLKPGRARPGLPANVGRAESGNR